MGVYENIQPEDWKTDPEVRAKEIKEIEALLEEKKKEPNKLKLWHRKKVK